jgi:hypothetical protein
MPEPLHPNHDAHARGPRDDGPFDDGPFDELDDASDIGAAVSDFS